MPIVCGGNLIVQIPDVNDRILVLKARGRHTILSHQSQRTSRHHQSKLMSYVDPSVRIQRVICTNLRTRFPPRRHSLLVEELKFIDDEHSEGDEMFGGDVVLNVVSDHGESLRDKMGCSRRSL